MLWISKMQFLSFCHLPSRAQGCNKVRMVITYLFNLCMPKAHASCKITGFELFSFTNKQRYFAIEVGWENIDNSCSSADAWHSLGCCISDTCERVFCAILCPISVWVVSSPFCSWSVEDISAWQFSLTSYVSVHRLAELVAAITHQSCTDVFEWS